MRYVSWTDCMLLERSTPGTFFPSLFCLILSSCLFIKFTFNLFNTYPHLEFGRAVWFHFVSMVAKMSTTSVPAVIDLLVCSSGCSPPPHSPCPYQFHSSFSDSLLFNIGLLNLSPSPSPTFTYSFLNLILFPSFDPLFYLSPFISCSFSMKNSFPDHLKHNVMVL